MPNSQLFVEPGFVEPGFVDSGSSTSVALQYLVHRSIAYFGGGSSGIIRRRHSLQSGTTGGGAADALQVQATTAIGASSLPIKASTGGLQGVLPAGFTFTVAGNATIYTTSAAAEADDTGKLTVYFSPVLAAQATLNAAVTLGADYVDATYLRVRGEFAEEDVSERIEATFKRLYVSAVDATSAPQEGDVWIDDDGSRQVVQRIRRLSPGSVDAGYVLMVGAA